MTKCSVKGCKGYGHSHLLPPQIMRFCQWSKIINRSDIPYIKRKFYAVCDRHFAPDMFAQMEGNRLKLNAFPCLNLPPPDEPNDKVKGLQEIKKIRKKTKFCSVSSVKPSNEPKPVKISKSLAECNFKIKRKIITVDESEITKKLVVVKTEPDLPIEAPVVHNGATKLPFFDATRIVWVELGLTGFDAETHNIMEVAFLVTDSDLNIIAEGPNLIIHQPPAVLDNMDEWYAHRHDKTRLTKSCLQSTTGIEEAEKVVMDFLRDHVVEKKAPLAGSCVYMDRLFIRKFMPTVNNYLHYRVIDVSTVKDLCERWNGVVYHNIPEKDFCINALEKIKESVKELKYYKSDFFKTYK